MRDVKLWTQVSLDGYIEGPGGEFDWPAFDEEMQTFALEQAAGMGGFLFGRKVYEGMVAYWSDPSRFGEATELDLEYSRIWKPMPKVVFSRTLEHADWNTTVVADNIAEEVAKLKEQPGGDLVLFGGAEIAATFVRLGLIDEFWLFVHPVVLGGGKSLFPELEQRRKLRLLTTRTFGSGAVHLRYSPNLPAK